MTGRLRSTLRDEGGMTIAELAVVALLTGLVGAMIMVSLSTTVRASSLVQDKSASLQDMRTAIEVIERDLRAANPIDAIDAALPISTYANKLTFSVYCSTVGVDDCSNEHLRSVTYQLVGNQLERVQGTTTKILVGPSDTPSLPIDKRRGAVVNTASQPVFRYFDKHGVELPTSGASTPPSSQFRDCVRHVDIYLVVVSAAGETPTTMQLTTSGTLRNFNEVDGC